MKYLEDVLARLISESFDLLSKTGPLKGSQNITDFFPIFTNLLFLFYQVSDSLSLGFLYFNSFEAYECDTLTQGFAFDFCFT